MSAGHPEEERGQIVKAFVVLRATHSGYEAMMKAQQGFMKTTLASFKYTRAVEFRRALPRTQTGKLQRFSLAGIADCGLTSKPSTQGLVKGQNSLESTRIVFLTWAVHADATKSILLHIGFTGQQP